MDRYTNEKFVEDFKTKIRKLRKQLDGCRKELRESNKTMDVFQCAFFREINLTRTGLEPISDQTFRERFGGIYHDVRIKTSSASIHAR